MWLKALECTVKKWLFGSHPWVSMGQLSTTWSKVKLLDAGKSELTRTQWMQRQTSSSVGQGNRCQEFSQNGPSYCKLAYWCLSTWERGHLLEKKSAVVWEGECWYSRYVLSASSSTCTCSSSCRLISWTHPSLGEPGALQTTPKVARLLEHRRSEIPRSRETRRLDTPNLFSHLPGSTSWQAVQ